MLLFKVSEEETLEQIKILVPFTTLFEGRLTLGWFGCIVEIAEGFGFRTESTTQ